MNSHETGADYTACEYKRITVKSDMLPLWLDGYESFGWQLDQRFAPPQEAETVTVHLRRDRRLVNRMELTRLQRNFEGCMEELAALERSKSQTATAVSVSVAVLGTVFMAGSVFAVTAAPPLLWLSVLLAVPGFAGWFLPLFLHRRLVRWKTRKVTPWMEKKYEEIDGLLEKGRSLL